MNNQPASGLEQELQSAYVVLAALHHAHAADHPAGSNARQWHIDRADHIEAMSADRPLPQDTADRLTHAVIGVYAVFLLLLIATAVLR